MKYRVEVTDQAKAQADEAYRYIFERAPDNATRWFYGLWDAMATLASMPLRCPLAPENDCFECEIRQLLYGNYRVLFEVRDNTVYVLHIRHGARRHLGTDAKQSGQTRDEGGDP